MAVYSVSSGFYAKVRERHVPIVRKFTIGSSDYTAFVLKGGWPKITRNWNEIKPKSTSIKLANHGAAFNFLALNPAVLRAECRVQIGVQYAVGSEEVYPVFIGTMGRVTYTNGGTVVGMTMVDKFKPFSERTMGSRDQPVDLTSGGYSPSALAWTAISCYGGLSSVASSSNPDVDYASFLRWAEVFSTNSVLAQAYFDGQKVTEVLRKIGRMTGTSILEEGGKVVFARYDLSSTAPTTLTSGDLFAVSAEVDDQAIINRQTVSAGYDVNSEVFDVFVYDVVSYSVSSYGLREQNEEDKNVWYVNSISALDFAQKATYLKKDPRQAYTVEVGTQLLARQVGDTIAMYHGLLGVAGDPFRMTGYALDMNKMKFQAELDASAQLTFFTLDDATLGVLDGTTNPLG